MARDTRRTRRIARFVAPHANISNDSNVSDGTGIPSEISSNQVAYVRGNTVYKNIRLMFLRQGNGKIRTEKHLACYVSYVMVMNNCPCGSYTQVPSEGRGEGNFCLFIHMTKDFNHSFAYHCCNWSVAHYNLFVHLKIDTSIRKSI